jgi:hypothetical protein
MESTAYRWLAVCLVVAVGCSSSGIFGGRGTNGRSKIADAFAPSRDGTEADDSPGRGTTRLARAKDQKKQLPARSEPTLDPVERRRMISDQLAAAARHERAGDAASTRAAYEQVVQLDGSHPLANYQLAVIADNEGRFDEAERRYRLLLRKSPRNSDLLASLGWSYLLQRRFEESERSLKEALAVDPKHRTALYNLGWLYGTQGDYDRALEVFRSAGSEEDAQQAIAQLFPRGRPATGLPAAGTPRNPFASKEKSSGARGNRASRQPDPLADGPISAPAPWQKQGVVSAAGTAARPEIRSTPERGKPPRGGIPDDDVFADLEPLRPAGSSVIQAGGSVQPGDAASAEGLPIITPKRGVAQPLVDQLAATDVIPRRSPSASPPAKSELAAPGPARPTNSLPDWPDRFGVQRGSSDDYQRQSQTAAAIGLGLPIGPAGLPFPLLPTP